MGLRKSKRIRIMFGGQMSIYNENLLERKIEKDDGVILKLPIMEKTDFLTFGIVEISPGKNTKEHAHDNGEEFMFVIEGNGFVVIDSEKNTIKKGDLIFIRSHQKHQILNVSDKYLKLLIGVSPSLDV
ncbi:MAG: cupin domain-containing protein [Candidatus Humimicrobiaceae bacterium]